jgi:SulP family sulfate permease
VLAVQLALLAGLLQLAFGALRLAHFADLLSHPVLHGFINACSVLICLAQLPALLGSTAPASCPLPKAWPTWPAACPAPTCRPSPSARRPSCC